MMLKKNRHKTSIYSLIVSFFLGRLNRKVRKLSILAV